MEHKKRYVNMLRKRLRSEKNRVIILRQTLADIQIAYRNNQEENDVEQVLVQGWV
jgi:hypothetical protein